MDIYKHRKNDNKMESANEVHRCSQGKHPPSSPTFEPSNTHQTKRSAAGPKANSKPSR
jgi:hypothetical protein